VHIRRVHPRRNRTTESDCSIGISRSQTRMYVGSPLGDDGEREKKRKEKRMEKQQETHGSLSAASDQTEAASQPAARM